MAGTAVLGFTFTGAWFATEVDEICHVPTEEEMQRIQYGWSPVVVLSSEVFE